MKYPLYWGIFYINKNLRKPAEAIEERNDE